MLANADQHAPIMKTIDIARDFTKYPAGRVLDDGPFSGERFRKDFLEPIIRSGEHAVISFDGAIGYGSSFLEEAFGGLVRECGYNPKAVLDAFDLNSSDESLVAEITDYINNAVKDG